MKLKKIKVGDYVAARVKRYEHSRATTERCRVKAVDGLYVTLFVPVWQEKRSVYFTVIDAIWDDYKAELDREAAAYEAERKRQTAAWEARRAAERARFEENILPAFAGLPVPDGFPEDRYADLANYIDQHMLEGGSTTVTLREDSLAAIAARIRELGDVIAQTALTADDLPQAGWGVTPEQIAEQAECIACKDKGGPGPLDPCPACNRYPDLPPNAVIEIPLSDLGLVVPDGDA